MTSNPSPSLFQNPPHLPTKLVVTICAAPIQPNEKQGKNVYFAHPMFNGSEIKEWPLKTELCCLNDLQPFTGLPIPAAEEYIQEQNTFRVRGMFCGRACRNRWILSQAQFCEMKRSQMIMVSAQMDRQVFGFGGDVTPAPPIEALSLVGGPLPLAEYRKNNHPSHHIQVSIKTRPFITSDMLFEFAHMPQHQGVPIASATVPQPLTAVDPTSNPLATAAAVAAVQTPRSSQKASSASQNSTEDLSKLHGMRVPSVPQTVSTHPDEGIAGFAAFLARKQPQQPPATLSDHDTTATDKSQDMKPPAVATTKPVAATKRSAFRTITPSKSTSRAKKNSTVTAISSVPVLDANLFPVPVAVPKPKSKSIIRPKPKPQPTASLVVPVASSAPPSAPVSTPASLPSASPSPMTTSTSTSTSTSNKKRGSLAAFMKPDTSQPHRPFSST